VVDLRDASLPSHKPVPSRERAELREPERGWRRLAVSKEPCLLTPSIVSGRRVHAGMSLRLTAFFHRHELRQKFNLIRREKLTESISRRFCVGQPSEALGFGFLARLPPFPTPSRSKYHHTCTECWEMLGIAIGPHRDACRVAAFSNTLSLPSRLAERWLAQPHARYPIMSLSSALVVASLTLQPAVTPIRFAKRCFRARGKMHSRLINACLMHLSNCCRPLLLLLVSWPRARPASAASLLL